jgi:CRP/FNR family transcriptional regulator
LYLVDAGTIGVYRRRGHGEELIEFAFAGDVLGFGYCEQHHFTAVALGTARVRLLPLALREEALPGGARNRQRRAEAIDREFLARREELVAAFRGDPVRRLAAFLLAVSELNRHEGRDAHLITDAVRCASVTACLGLDVTELAAALLELQRLRLVAPSPPSDLRLTDCEGLRRLSAEPPATER